MTPPDAPPALPAALRPAPREASGTAIRHWYDTLTDTQPAAPDGKLASDHAAAFAYALAAKSANTRRAYRAGVAAWCAWCDARGVPALPARAEDVAGFLAASRGDGLSPATLNLRRAAIRHLHFLAGAPLPTAAAAVAETLAGIRRSAAQAGELPAKKAAATATILRRLLAPIEDDLRGRRDRALLLVGFAGALRRAELAAIRLEHLEPTPRGLRLTLPTTKGERSGAAVSVPLPHGDTELCPVRAIRLWREAAGLREGPLFRRIWAPSKPRGDTPPPLPRIGSGPIDSGTVARIVQQRAEVAGFARHELGGHSLKRGALTTGMERGAHPARLRRLGRHRSYAVLGEYLEFGDLFEGHPLDGVL